MRKALLFLAIIFVIGLFILGCGEPTKQVTGEIKEVEVDYEDKEEVDSEAELSEDEEQEEIIESEPEEEVRVEDESEEEEEITKDIGDDSTEETTIITQEELDALGDGLESMEFEDLGGLSEE
jgi:hypothetical protein